MLAKATVTVALVGAAMGGVAPAAPAFAAHVYGNAFAGYAAPVPKVAAYAAPAPLAYAAPVAKVATYSAAPIAYAAPAALAYSAPIAKTFAAPVVKSYAAPAVHAPLAYATTIPSFAKVAAPVAYAAPVAKFAAPVVAKVAAPIYAPQPYEFGYETVDEFGTKQSRHEKSDANNAKIGSYGFTDARGIYRQVNYIADAAGFRATISTNEPGTAPSAPAAAIYNAAPIAVKAVKVAAPVLTKAVVPAPAVFAAPAFSAPAVKVL